MFQQHPETGFTTPDFTKVKTQAKENNFSRKNFLHKKLSGFLHISQKSKEKGTNPFLSLLQVTFKDDIRTQIAYRAPITSKQRQGKERAIELVKNIEDLTILVLNQRGRHLVFQTILGRGRYVV